MKKALIIKTIILTLLILPVLFLSNYLNPFDYYKKNHY